MRMRTEPIAAGFWRPLLPLLLAVLTFGFSALGGPVLFRASAEEEAAVRRVAGVEDRIGLTFDVTWGRDELDKIVEVLEKHQVKATFFVGGTFLQLHGDRVRMLASRGHEVATLGQRMTSLDGLPEQEVTSNLLASQSALSRTLGSPVRFFRPPLGPATPAVVRAARSAELTTVTFSLDSRDHLGATKAQILHGALRPARGGEIIRLTASDWTPATAAALPDLLDGLKAKGLKPVPLSALLPG